MEAKSIEACIYSAWEFQLFLMFFENMERDYPLMRTTMLFAFHFESFYLNTMIEWNNLLNSH